MYWVVGQKHQTLREFGTDDISPRFIYKNPCSMYVRVLHMIAQFVLKNRKIVPYHGDNPNTRNGARLQSPSPIMAPVIIELFRIEWNAPAASWTVKMSYVEVNKNIKNHFAYKPFS